MCQMCAEIQDVVVVRSLDALPRPHDLLRILNSFAPQLVLLEASAGGLSKDLAQELVDFHPEISLITFRAQSQGGDGWNPASLGLLTLNIPFSGEEFQDSLFGAMSRSPSKGAQGRLIAFLPVKGGSGATTTALATATVLSQRLLKRIAFLECDIHSGPAAIYLGLRPTCSIIDVLEDAQLLDFRPFTQLVTRHGELDVLPSVGRRPSHRLSPWSCQRMLSRARNSYDFVFCDLPVSVDESFEPVLRAADHVVLVTTPSEVSGFLVERRLAGLSQLGVGNAKVSVVVNRSLGRGPDGKCASVPVNIAIPARPALYDASRIDLAQLIGDELDGPFTSIAEVCAGRPLPTQQSKRNSLASFWRGVLPGPNRSRNSGAKV